MKMSKIIILMHVRRWISEGDSSAPKEFKEGSANIIHWRTNNNKFKLRYSSYVDEDSTDVERLTLQEKERFYAEFIWIIRVYIKRIQ